MKLIFFSSKSYDKDSFESIKSEFDHELTFLESALTKKTAVLAKGHDAVCTFVNDHLDRETLEELANVGIKAVLLRCAGFNQVDLPAAKELGIHVARVPAYSPQAVAEHAVAMILTLNRKTHKAYNRVREGNFSLERLTGFNLYGKVVGVIGLGKIGVAFAAIMNGFGCRVIAYDPVTNAAPEYIKLTSIDEVLTSSDIISIHCPLTDETRHLINKDNLQKMKPGAMLINTSRGAVICTKDVIHSLKIGHLGYLGIDVYEQEEKLFFRDLSESVIDDDMILRLMSFPNVLVTAHQAFFTTEALHEIAATTLQNAADIGEGAANANCLV
ncbi:2-hydroxyacid dehydrogenase [Pedobacter sp. HMF7647]|uniref:2-hydroxyacid dehydrogenase n=1 Tax=Hufsiella arboris TaxID=2695275 RepID=A0A7K1Y932_9SPHI|nr:2-hydroxyacid dehydrogenase [Hufsiella arboris]MXV51113.1 2-hydroxyacid dehydrogenase [Hufsiella arboris]